MYLKITWKKDKQSSSKCFKLENKKIFAAPRSIQTKPKAFGLFVLVHESENHNAVVKETRIKCLYKGRSPKSEKQKLNTVINYAVFTWLMLAQLPN